MVKGSGEDLGWGVPAMWKRFRSLGLRTTMVSNDKGYSFVELLVVTSLLLILASAVIPLSKVATQRQKEVELRRALRELRVAIDDYKDAVDLGVIAGTAVEPADAGYPPDLETLVAGIEPVDGEDGQKIRFLRRIPVDPMMRSSDWGLRGYDDELGARTWSGNNVYDVYSKSPKISLNGTKYMDW